MREYTSGSCSRSQRSFGAVKPVSARFPVSSIRRSRPTRRSISAHCAAVRWSFQRIAGRSGTSFSSSATRPCIWPDQPSASASTRASARSVARTQSSGSCSAQPGWGVESAYDSPSRACTSPSASIPMPLTPLVPTSIPTSTSPAPAPASPAPPLSGVLRRAYALVRYVLRRAYALGTQRRVDDLVGAYCVLSLLRFAQRRVVDPGRDAVDEAPVKDRTLDSGNLILRIRIEVEAEPLALLPVVRAPQLECELDR